MGWPLPLQALDGAQKGKLQTAGKSVFQTSCLWGSIGSMLYFGYSHFSPFRTSIDGKQSLSIPLTFWCAIWIHLEKLTPLSNPSKNQHLEITCPTPPRVRTSVLMMARMMKGLSDQDHVARQRGWGAWNMFSKRKTRLWIVWISSSQSCEAIPFGNLT